MRFRAKPIDVDAVQVTCTNHDELSALLGAQAMRTGRAVCVHTTGGIVHAAPGDWIVVAPPGAPFVLTAKAFAVYFEAVPDEHQVENYKTAKARYDDAYAMWIASGRQGAPPPRPVPPHVPGPSS